ncbi:MAG TPA: hypothetical protein VIV11_04000 [Kofleriaceae bacterium]
MRALAVICTLWFTVAPARADDAAAKALFDQGKTLFAEGKYGEACAKLEASFKLSQLSSTRGLLGACYEKVGKLASAWVAYRDSAAIAERQGHAERAQAAREKAAELEPKLAKLAIDTTAAKPVTGLEVTIDGVVQPSAALDQPLPIDGGPHVIAADAKGYKKWQSTVDIVDGEQQKTAVPMLVADPKELEAPSVDRTMSRRRKIGLAVGGGGVLLLGASGAFGLLAISSWDSSGCNKDTRVCDDAAAQEQGRSAATRADIATGLGIAGVAVLGAGLAIFLTAPKYESAQITPVIGRDGAAVLVEGRF